MNTRTVSRSLASVAAAVFALSTAACALQTEADPSSDKTASTSEAASIAFDFECNRAAAFLQDPNVHPRVGYVTSLAGLGLPAALKADLQVATPCAAASPSACARLGATATGTANVVGVIEKFSWAGGVGSPLQIDLWTSQENAFQLKALQQRTLTTTAVSSLGFWIGNYDQETKQWFEQAFVLPGTTGGALGAVSGVLAGGAQNPDLNIDVAGVTAASGIDLMVYKVSIQVVPAANHAYTLQLANSSTAKVVKSWGLVVGTLPVSALP